jgi:hypothetical protein
MGTPYFCVLALTVLIAFGVSSVEETQPSAEQEQRPSKRATSMKLYPVDESSSDPPFAQFKARLLEEIQRRNLKFILSTAHPEIFLGSPEDFPNPMESLKSFFQASSFETDMWGELDLMLRLGVVRTRGGFCAPYVYRKFPQELDPFEYLVITSTDVKVRAEAKSTAPVIETLSYDIVRLESIGYIEPEETIGGERHPWWRIVTPSGKTGHVWGKYARRPIDLEVCFKKIDGQWMMASLVAHSD